MKKILLLSIVASFALSCSKDALETFPGDKVPSDVVYGSVENARSAPVSATTIRVSGSDLRRPT